MDKNKSIFAQRLRYLLSRNIRDGKKVSDSDQANEMSISYDTLRGYYNSDANPSANTLILIAKYFNVSIDYLLGLSKEEPISNDEALEERCRKCGLCKNNEMVIDWLVENKDVNIDAYQTLAVINFLLPHIEVWKAIYQYAINKNPFYLDEDETTVVKQLYRGGIQNAQNLRQSYLFELFQYLNSLAEGRGIEPHYEPT